MLSNRICNIAESKRISKQLEFKKEYVHFNRICFKETFLLIDYGQGNNFKIEIYSI